MTREELLAKCMARVPDGCELHTQFQVSCRMDDAANFDVGSEIQCRAAHALADAITKAEKVQFQKTPGIIESITHYRGKVFVFSEDDLKQFLAACLALCDDHSGDATDMVPPEKEGMR